MKITTWNVNGLRAALKNGIWDWVREYYPDILCLQEIKVRPDQLNGNQNELFKGYQVIWNPAERPGYSGVATFLKQGCQKVILGLGDSRFDHEGRVIETHHEEFTLLNLYVPNGQRDHARVPFKLDFYATLLDKCNRMHGRGERLILCGDINTAHQEIDLRNPKQNVNTTGFLLEERDWITHFLNNGFVDIYRERYPNREQYTWWTYRFGARKRNVGWRLDYFLVSEELRSLVQEVVIHDEVMGSDHCPVTLILDGGVWAGNARPNTPILPPTA